WKIIKLVLLSWRRQVKSRALFIYMIYLKLALPKELPMDELHNKAKKIKLLLLDVDGVLTDGSVWYSDSGTELKPFNIKDGLGIKLLQQGDIATGIITGRNSPIVERRAKELGINWVIQG